MKERPQSRKRNADFQQQDEAYNWKEVSNRRSRNHNNIRGGRVHYGGRGGSGSGDYSYWQPRAPHARVANVQMDTQILQDTTTNPFAALEKDEILEEDTDGEMLHSTHCVSEEEGLDKDLEGSRSEANNLIEDQSNQCMDIEDHEKVGTKRVMQEEVVFQVGESPSRAYGVDNPEFESLILVQNRRKSIGDLVEVSDLANKVNRGLHRDSS